MELKYPVCLPFFSPFSFFHPQNNCKNELRLVFKIKKKKKRGKESILKSVARPPMVRKSNFLHRINYRLHSVTLVRVLLFW